MLDLFDQSNGFAGVLSIFEFSAIIYFPIALKKVSASRAEMPMPFLVLINTENIFLKEGVGSQGSEKETLRPTGEKMKKAE